MSRATRVVNWRDEFLAWLTPFLAAFEREAQRHWAPVYLEGLLGPGERKSVEPMAARVCPGETQQLHHFVSAAPWATAPLERALAVAADRLVGGPDAVLIIDDTALPKQGAHSVGVARQYCGALGKKANCQVLVSLTLARDEVPVPLALRLYLPETWASDPERRARAKVPAAVTFQTKGDLALAELDRVTAAGVRFGLVLANAGYGTAAEFRSGLTARGLRWAVGILGVQKVYPADVTLAPPMQGPTGRPQKHPVPSVTSVPVETMIDALGPRAFRRLSWRTGTKGPLAAEFAAVRVRVADGPLMAKAQHLPGEAAWLVCERRAAGEQKYYLTNHPAGTPLRTLARAIKARWVCEQAHQQLKEELGLDHFEGRSWLGLHHHALLTMVAFAFLQHRRLAAAAAPPPARRRRVGGKTGATRARPTTRAVTPRDAPHAPRSAPRDHRSPLSALSLPAPAPAA